MLSTLQNSQSQLKQKNPKRGIQEVRYIDPRKIKKVREIKKKRDVKSKGIEVVEQTAEWFVYNEKGMQAVIKSFSEDCNYLNCENPTEQPKATEHIDLMIDMIV